VRVCCLPDPPCGGENLRTLKQRVDLAEYCVAEAQEDLTNAKTALDELAGSSGTGGSAPLSTRLYDASVAVAAHSEAVAKALQLKLETQAAYDDTQLAYDRAGLWQFAGGVTGYAALSAPGHTLTGIGPSLIYRPTAQLELDAIVRWDRLNNDLGGLSLRGLIGFNSGPWGFLGGIGMSQTGTNERFEREQLVLVLPLALRYRFGRELRCLPAIPVLDLAVMAEPWLVGTTDGPLESSSVMFGVSATLSLAGIRAGSRENLGRAEPAPVICPSR
jgi:hypothetical protein